MDMMRHWKNKSNTNILNIWMTNALYKNNTQQYCNMYLYIYIYIEKRKEGDMQTQHIYINNKRNKKHHMQTTWVCLSNVMCNKNNESHTKHMPMSRQHTHIWSIWNEVQITNTMIHTIPRLANTMYCIHIYIYA